MGSGIKNNLIDYINKKSDLGNFWNMLNNYWSVCNNTNQQSKPEAFRSLILELLDMIEMFAGYLNESNKRKIGYQRLAGVVSVFETGERLIRVTMPQIVGAADPNSTYYNNGKIKKSLLIDAVSDVSNIVSKLIDIVKVVPTPLSIAAGIVSTYTG